MNDILSYEALVTEFEEGLLTRLRGHRSMAPFLEMWVPDEDPIRSLLSMFEAAELAGEGGVSIKISRESLAGRDIREVETMATQFGSCRLEEDADGWRVLLFMKAQDDQLQTVAPPFRERLRERIGRLQHSGGIQGAKDQERTLMIEIPQAVMTLIVGPDRQILRAGHARADSVVTEAMLDHLCDVFIGLPLEEAAHHGCHRLLARLRDRSFANPVSGVVLPHNAGLAFSAPHAICLALKPAWTASGQNWSDDNSFSDPPRAAWLALSQEERAAKIQTILLEDQAAQFVGIGDNLLGYPIRVLIALSDQLATEEKPACVLRIERLLAARLEPRLEVYVEELKDQSGIRRL